MIGTLGDLAVISICNWHLEAIGGDFEIQPLGNFIINQIDIC